MPDAERARNINTLNKLFALGSIVMALVVVWMVINDSSREWKYFQKRFYQLEYGKTRAALSGIRAAADYKRDKSALDMELKSAEAELKQHKKDYEAATKKAQSVETDRYKANQEYQFAKSRYLAARYEFEAAAAVNNGAPGGKAAPSQLTPKAMAYQKELDAKKSEMDKAELRYMEAEARYTAAQQDVEKYLAKNEAANKKKDKLNEQVDRLEKKLKHVDLSSPSRWLLDAPLMDFMAPSLKIQQIVVDGVTNDLNFMRIPRVDRCITCHMAYETKGYETPGIRQPYRTHPNLDIFVGAKSKHPADRFGCTSCHQGRDRGTTFTTAVHWPVDEKQAHEWNRKWDWKEYEHWDTPMMPGSYVESQCYKCHKSQTFIAEAPQLNRGRILFERAGCYGCHKVQGFEGLRKAGPDLTHLVDKVTPEWTFKWIKDPKSFRPTTRMPKFFDLTNTKTPDDLERNNVEAHALVSYLFSLSEKLEYRMTSLVGDPGRGKELVTTLGCTGCHYVETPKEKVPVDDRRMSGPTLDKLGSKTNAQWVFNWLKNPKQYFPETNMPNLRLSDQEAIDVSSYLMSLRDTEFERKNVPAINTSVLDSLAEEYLKVSISATAARAKLASWSQPEKEAYLGERLVNRYGCFGCHTIKGFEKAQNIGTELTEEGSKNIHQLDFGFVNIPHTRHDWFQQKLRDPRIFDMMPNMQTTKVKRPDEKSKMPNFQFSEEEIRALVTFVLGLTKEKILPDLSRNLSTQESAIEEGRRLVKKFNCQGCHILENQGGDIRKTITDPGFYPPILEGEGEMVKADWLYNFLRNPQPIRPWIKVRMPTFNFSDVDLNVLTRYFAYLSKTNYPYEHYDYVADAANVAAGKGLMDRGQCFKCHILNGVAPPNDAANLAPDLGLARNRLRPQWIVEWLKDPQKIKPNTRMPTFFVEGNALDPAVLGGKPEPQMEAIRDYVLSIGSKDDIAAAARTKAVVKRRPK
ncbi:MAG: c-type cytochrome [Acidobacteria bacterium]|nr:c-type cytochrome [Acidobacteriota bacterium]MBI3656955.1 c-type cytochrome [Acidobacteriota bacterium]